jgi:CheY-like chemotaxis protein
VRAGPPSRRRRRAPRAGEGQTLLVVEDDEAVRDLVSMMVRRNGYHAIAVDSPERALEVFAESEQPIDMLLSDMVMPGMSGIELAEAVRSRRPSLPVLPISGYAAVPSGHAPLPDGVSLLRKPFTTVALMRALDGVLHGAG